MILTIKGTSNKLTVSGYFSADATTTSAADAFQFENGIIWTVNTVKSRVLNRTASNDASYGSRDAIIPVMGGGEPQY